jgi:hypothetical protein
MDSGTKRTKKLLRTELTQSRTQIGSGEAEGGEEGGNAEVEVLGLRKLVFSKTRPPPPPG